MIRQEMWNKIKTKASATQTGDVVALDSLLAKYHTCAKSDVQNRFDITQQVIVAAAKLRGKALMDGASIAATILLGSAVDTRDRLEMDINAVKVTEHTGHTAKALEKTHRHEALDPQHRRWGCPGGIGGRFAELRQLWKDHLLEVASKPNPGEMMVESFYDWLGKRGSTTAGAKSKFYTPEQRERKRLVAIAPGPHNNKEDTRFFRQKKDGTMVPYTTSGLRIFVLTEANRFYTCNPQQSKDGEGMKHHSGLADGEVILGAGAMKLQGGKIREITQQSGHYRPRIDQLLNVLKHLKETGADLSGTTVSAYTYFRDPQHQKPDERDPNAIFPDMQTVSASYYLETEGAWAYDPRLYAASPTYNSATSLETLGIAAPRRNSSGYTSELKTTPGYSSELKTTPPYSSELNAIQPYATDLTANRRLSVREEVRRIESRIAAQGPAYSTIPNRGGSQEGDSANNYVAPEMVPPAGNAYGVPIKALGSEDGYGVPKKVAASANGYGMKIPAGSGYGVPISANGSAAVANAYGVKIPKFEDDGPEWL